MLSDDVIRLEALRIASELDLGTTSGTLDAAKKFYEWIKEGQG